MSLKIALILTVISGLGVFALVNWIAMSEEKLMAHCRKVVLAIASVPLSLFVMWWVGQQLEYLEVSLDNPNVELTSRPTAAERTEK